MDITDVLEEGIAKTVQLHPEVLDFVSTRVRWIAALKGGPGSGNFGHEGRPGEVGGSASSSGPGEAARLMSSAPIGRAKSPEAKRWRKEHQAEDENNRDFRILTDVATLYAAGNYGQIRDFSEYVVTGRFSDGVPEESMVRDWARDNFAMSGMSNSMAQYDAYFEGQDVNSRALRENSDASVLEAAAIFHQAVCESPPLDYPIYRGGQVYATISKVQEEDGSIRTKIDRPEIPKVGEEINILGTTSFSASFDVADDFAHGRSRGQSSSMRDAAKRAEYTVVYEIEPGARGLNISPVSSWDQQEVVTTGQFVIKDVVPMKSDIWSSVSNRYVPAYKVTLEQTGVWDVNPEQYANQPIKRSYS